ncbi:hypothetical protein [Ferruginibacter sp.]|nr:hypothetical protein [Ferruginibacter sp.]
MKAFEEQVKKYVRLPGNEIIIFSKSIEHLAFKHLNPVSAGSCIIDAQKKKVHCYGLSITLHLQADEKEDTRLATTLIFGGK